MKTAIIGMGPHGKRLIQVVAKLKMLDLVGIVDKSQQVLDTITVSDHLKFTSTESLYNKHTDVEVVLIATNGPSHAPLAIEAMEKGARRVMVEKPMACSIEECNEMISFAKKKNVRLSVDKKNRHDPVFQYFKSQLKSGAWGNLRHVFMQIPGIGLGCLGTHWFDVVNYMLDSTPVQVTGWVDSPKKNNPRGAHFVDPGGLVVCDYGNETRAVFVQIEDGAGPMTIEIHTTAARVIYDPKNAFLHILQRDLTQTPGPGKPPVYSVVEPPAYLNLKGDMLEQIEGVVRELITDKPMLTDGVYGKDAIEILLAVYESQEHGNIPITLPVTRSEYIKRKLSIT